MLVLLSRARGNVSYVIQLFIREGGASCPTILSNWTARACHAKFGSKGILLMIHRGARLVSIHFLSSIGSLFPHAWRQRKLPPKNFFSALLVSFSNIVRLWKKLRLCEIINYNQILTVMWVCIIFKNVK